MASWKKTVLNGSERQQGSSNQLRIVMKKCGEIGVFWLQNRKEKEGKTTVGSFLNFVVVVWYE